MASYPKDQFDQLPRDLERIGAHRGPKRRGRGWIAFAWAALATLVLIVAGLFGLNRFMGIDVGLPIFDAAPTATPTPTAAPTADPVTDPATIDAARGIKITILNATGTSGVQTTVGDQLAAAGWPVSSRIVAAEPVDDTFVYYSDPLNEDVARGVVLALGLGEIRLVSPETFPGQPIVVAVGVDFLGPVPTAEPTG
ncbi:MAG: LytR C-terminal domain-containing protein [Rhodoglobus sp.]